VTVVALLGGSGRLGSWVLDHLLAGGNTVRALVHRNGLAAGSRIVSMRGDVHEVASLAKLLDGATMVVSTLGAAGSPTADVCSAAVRNLVPLMTSRGITRIVTTTGSAARLDAEIGREHRWLAARRAALMRHMAPLILDGEEHMRLLAGSSLDWTVLRLPIMQGDFADRAALAESPGPPDATLGYDVVAKMLVDELLARRWIGAAPFAVRA
jgi:putative NADH-flavin reductase